MAETRKLVPFRYDRPPRQILERFAGKQPTIVALWRADPEFRDICRDYREALASLRPFEETGAPEERKRPFVELVEELEREMLALVERHD